MPLDASQSVSVKTRCARVLKVLEMPRYRPNFCAECGERVMRARWRVWTSRRFCSGCARRFRRKSLVGSLALASAFVAAGFALGRVMRPASPPLVVERGALDHVPVMDATRRPCAGRDGATNAERDNATETRRDGATDAKHDGAMDARLEGAPSNPEPVYGPDGTANERPTDPNEVVYICGARTKKGAPCQRRVRGPFRCWQHRGMPAMLPPSKLIVPN